MAPYIFIGGYSDPPRIPHLSLEVNRSELVALVGGPGSGKSNLMQCLAGIRTYKRGSIRILGAKPGSMRSRENTIFVFQNCNYAPDTVVRFQIEQRVSLLRGAPRKDVKHDVLEWCEKRGLQEVSAQVPEKLNISELQLFSLAPLSLSNPSVVILDEPLRNISGSRIDDALEIVLSQLDKAAILVLVQKQSPLLVKADRIMNLL